MAETMVAKKKSQQVLDNELKDVLYERIAEVMSEVYGEVYKVGATETGLAYRLASPCCDSEHNEKTVIVAISIPRTNRQGESYDVYEASADYAARMEAHEEEVKAKAEKKAREEAEKERKRAERQSKRKTARKKVEE